MLSHGSSPSARSGWDRPNTDTCSLPFSLPQTAGGLPRDGSAPLLRRGPRSATAPGSLSRGPLAPQFPRCRTHRSQLDSKSINHFESFCGLICPDEGAQLSVEWANRGSGSGPHVGTVNKLLDVVKVDALSSDQGCFALLYGEETRCIRKYLGQTQNLSVRDFPIGHLPPKLEGIVEVAACTHRHQGIAVDVLGNRGGEGRLFPGAVGPSKRHDATQACKGKGYK